MAWWGELGHCGEPKASIKWIIGTFSDFIDILRPVVRRSLEQTSLTCEIHRSPRILFVSHFQNDDGNISLDYSRQWRLFFMEILSLHVIRSDIIIFT